MNALACCPKALDCSPRGFACSPKPYSHGTGVLPALFHFCIYLLQECAVVLSVSNPDQLLQCTFRLAPDAANPKGTCTLNTPGEVEFTLEPKNEAFSLDDSIETDPDKEK